VAYFFREHRGQPFASSALMESISKRFRSLLGPSEEPSSLATSVDSSARRERFHAHGIAACPMTAGLLTGRSRA